MCKGNPSGDQTRREELAPCFALSMKLNYEAVSYSQGRRSCATDQLLWSGHLGAQLVMCWQITACEWRERSGRTHWLLSAPGRLISCATPFRIRDQSLPRIPHYIANDLLIDLVGKVPLKEQDPQQMTKCSDSYDCFLEMI